MNIAEARSFENGLEFYLHEKNMTLCVTRNQDGNIDISTTNYVKHFKRENASFKTKFFAFILAIIITSLQFLNLHTGVNLLIITGIIWIATFALYYFDFKNPKNAMTYKYHAAEHKVLNYMDKYGESTDDFIKVKKMSSLSIRCGSTLVAVVYVLATFIILGVVFIPSLWLKLVWFAFSVYATLYMWANGKCYFFQKLALIEPSDAEVELATIGLCEYLKLKHNDC